MRPLVKDLYHRVKRRIIQAIAYFCLGLFVGQVLSATVRAEEPIKGDLARDQWPDQLVIEVGEIRTRISGEKLWTLSGAEYRDSVMATEDSAYGSVLVIRGAGLLGTAHFLDIPGKPGEVEKENVTNLSFTLDGQAFDQIPPSKRLVGESFRYQRDSFIRTLRRSSSISIERNLIIETVNFRASDRLDLQCVYPWMYAWNKTATAYVFGNNREIVKRGEFRPAGEVRTEMFKDVTWMATYDAACEQGSVCCSIQHPAGADLWFLLIDAPEAYRKVIGYSLENTVLEPDFTGTYQAAVSFFRASKHQWESVARQRAYEIRDSIK